MLQQEKPKDYIVANGTSHTVREFCERSFYEAGIELEWRGSGTSEIGIVKSTAFSPNDGDNRLPEPGQAVVAIDPRYFRPTEVENLLGDASKARDELGWEPTVNFEQLVKIMVTADIQNLQNIKSCQEIVRKIVNDK